MPNFVALKQPVSLEAVTAGAGVTYDFIANGNFSRLSIEDPIMSNLGPLAQSGGYIQFNYTAPALVYAKVFTATQTQKVLDLASGLGVSDFSGMLTVTASNSTFGTQGATGSATYILLISKSLAGNQVVEIAKAGLVTGASASHPSFTFTIDASGDLNATAISATAGTFWFAIEKNSGSLRF